ncbi:MAG: UbiH/UbiF/VisC/COQ6 family ubiquinone biosynthesis hydroxylase [Alphaproteobacteria bacterium]
MNNSPPLNSPSAAEVAIVGAGPAGLILAVALARSGIPVAVIDRRDPMPPGNGVADGGLSDGRVFALSAGSRRVLDGLGLWPELAAGAAPVNDILVSDRAGPPLVHFDHAEMEAGPLGHVVAADALQRVLADAARRQPGITFLAPAELTHSSHGREPYTNSSSPGVMRMRAAHEAGRSMDAPDKPGHDDVVKEQRASEGIVIGADSARVNFADGGSLGARLVVGADGRQSLVRDAARINVTEWTYDQAAIVVTIAHARPHDGAAEERFLAGGPFAVLPLTDGSDGAHRSSIVWTEPASRVADLVELGDDDFKAELRRRLPSRLGEARAVGACWTYPLALSLAESYIGNRVALIGDAAHAIHPIAGQGLNLGIRDAAALAEVIVDAHRLGLDIGMKTALIDYERWRRFDNTCLAAATDLLNRVFGIGNAPFGALRRAGMRVLDRIGPARRLFMLEAMGLNGDLPRLVRGEPL